MRSREFWLETYHAELETLRAVSTVPPKTTSFTPSMTEEPPAPPTRGCTSDLRASMTVRVYLGQRTIQCCDAERIWWDGRGRGGSVSTNYESGPKAMYGLYQRLRKLCTGQG